MLFLDLYMDGDYSDTKMYTHPSRMSSCTQEEREAEVLAIGIGDSVTVYCFQGVLDYVLLVVWGCALITWTHWSLTSLDPVQMLKMSQVAISCA